MICLAGDIPVVLAWWEAETVLVLATEDRDVVLWVTEQIEFAEEPVIRDAMVHTWILAIIYYYLWSYN